MSEVPLYPPLSRPLSADILATTGALFTVSEELEGLEKANGACSREPTNAKVSSHLALRSVHECLAHKKMPLP